MNAIVLSVVACLLAAWPLSANAETIILKNGEMVFAKIIEKDAQKIKAEVNGLAMTYYLDDIKTIEGMEAAEFMTPTVIQPKSMPQPQPAASAAPAQPSSEISGMSKKELILKFIDAFGTRASLTTNFADLMKKAPAKQAEEMKKAVNVDELIEELVPLYDKHFTEQELEAYIKFYSSPAGQKLLVTIPTLMTESVGTSLKYFKTKIPSIPSQGVE